MGAINWLERVRSEWPASAGKPPKSPAALFEQATEGSSRALRIIREHAFEIGRLAAGIVTVIDPGIVILGGGVGQHPLIAEEVQAYLDELPWPTEVRTTVLGSSGTAIGAARLVARDALDTLLRS